MTLAEKLARLDWGGITYPQYRVVMHGHEGQSSSAQANNEAQAKAAGVQREQNYATVDPLLRMFLPTSEKENMADTPLYRALYKNAVEGTSAAYRGATSNFRTRAGAAGFGYQQPIEQTGETGIDVARAHDMSQIPSETYLQTLQPAEWAAEVRENRGQSYNQDQQFFTGQANNLLNSRLQREQSLYNTMLSSAAGMAGSGMETGAMLA